MRFPKMVKFDEKGLVPAITQDAKNGEVLMMAWMNRKALERTLTTGRVHYYSRSRKTLWLKGEISGHIQKVRAIYYDCDGDTILIKIDQKGAACHEGYRSCFFRKGKGTRVKAIGKRLFNPKKVYR